MHDNIFILFLVENGGVQTLKHHTDLKFLNVGVH